MYFSHREIRRVLTSKVNCLKAGFSESDTIIKTLDEIRAYYIQRVGVTTYLRQMLGELGRTPLKYCVLYGEDGDPIKFEGRNYRQSVHRFIARQFELEGSLPFKVEIYGQGSLKQIGVCCL
jgi:hypothetical protein